MFLFCCWKHSRDPESPDCWSPCNVRGNTVEGEMEDGRGMVVEAECMVWLRNLGGRQMFRFTMADILVCVVVRIMGVVFFGEGSLLMMDLECSGLGFWLFGGDIFELVGDFVVLVVEVEVEGEE